MTDLTALIERLEALDRKATQSIVWANADTCIENADIVLADSICDEDDTPVDTVIDSGDLAVVLDLARQAVAGRNALPDILTALRAAQRVEEALSALAFAEADYRAAHDLYGDGSKEAGRAWDLMRRAGNHARQITTPTTAEGER